MADPPVGDICGRKLRTAKSRARRRGPVCDAKSRAVPAALPGLAGRGGPALQDGPDLFDEDDQP